MTALTVGGTPLTLADVQAVARDGLDVRLDDDPAVIARLEASRAAVERAVAEQRPVYGVTTRMGGMATELLTAEESEALQNRIVWLHKSGAGRPIPTDEVRAGMLLRLTSLARGYSGVRVELLERLCALLNGGVTPQVPEFGSIGASGDLVPLSYVAGAVVGAGDGFTVSVGGRELGAPAALAELGWAPLGLGPKEGLALVNGISMSAGVAALSVSDAEVLLQVTLGAHALMIEALAAGPEAFEPLQHELRPHPGQLWVAGAMRRLVRGSALMRPTGGYEEEVRGGRLIQDRYSVRCLPQFLCPILEEHAAVRRTMAIEINSVSDNPIIDPHDGTWHHGGNFMGSATSLAMDRLRHGLGMAAAHLDTQAALLMTPEFSNGLPGSLQGSTGTASLGLKGLQISANSVVPYLAFLGTPIADRFPTHAEQFNQNINSQSWLAARLSRDSVAAGRAHLAMCLLMAVQGVELRARIAHGTDDPTALLGAGSAALYTAVRQVLGRPQPDACYAHDAAAQQLDRDIAVVCDDLLSGGRLAAAVAAVTGPLMAADPPHEPHASLPLPPVPGATVHPESPA